MPGSITTVTSGLIGSAATALLAAAAWFGHRRDRAQHSGTINTSDASEIWKAAEQLRRELTERAEQLHDQVVELVDQVTQLSQANRDLQAMNRNLSRQVYRLTEILREHGIDATFHEHDPGGL